MHRVRYEPGSGLAQDAVELDGPLAFVGTGGGLRSSAWEYEMGYRGIINVTRAAREVETEAKMVSPAEADRMARVFDRDVAYGTPGRIIVDGAWEAYAYAVSSELGAMLLPYISVTLKFVIVDGTWRRWHHLSFPIEPAEQTGSYLDLPYDLPYDLGAPRAARYIETPAWAPAPARITIYGPVSNPAVTIGDNEYSFTIDIPAGGYLVCDGLEKSITLTGPYGDVTNAFDCGERGSGKGSGSYCFEPIAPGTSGLTRNKEFGLDIDYAEEVGKPPWDKGSS